MFVVCVLSCVVGANLRDGTAQNKFLFVWLIKCFLNAKPIVTEWSPRRSSMIVHVPPIPPHIPMPVELQRAHGHCIQGLEGYLELAKCHRLQSVVVN